MERSARTGAAAVEFALIAPAFIFLVVVGFDLGVAVLTQAVLNNAAKDASRLIQTQQASSSTFVNTACAEMAGLVPCSSLQYYVQSGSSFAGLSPTVVTSGSGNLANSGTYSPGALGQDVVVQLAYKRPTIVPWTMIFFNGSSSTVNTSNLLVSTIVFQNEPP
jgi:Flp pilus assembly protein TadG